MGLPAMSPDWRFSPDNSYFATDLLQDTGLLHTLKGLNGWEFRARLESDAQLGIHC